MSKPKILLLDIETAPLVVNAWGLFDQNISLNQIHSDWSILSWSAKWLGEKKIYYEDVSAQKDKRNDKKILKNVWKMIDDCDIMVTQNGIKFDVKKLNARFIVNGFQPPSSFLHIDTLRLAKKHFGFTSNKLEYMTNLLNTKYKKLKHEEFSGFELWKECLAGNKKAWKCMKKYNEHDVLALEELYSKLMPWDGDQTVKFSMFGTTYIEHVCSCGSTSFIKHGFKQFRGGKKQRHRCRNCGAMVVDSKLIKKPKAG